jgi:hypothetical protein
MTEWGLKFRVWQSWCLTTVWRDPESASFGSNWVEAEALGLQGSCAEHLTWLMARPKSHSFVHARQHSVGGSLHQHLALLAIGRFHASSIDQSDLCINYFHVWNRTLCQWGVTFPQSHLHLAWCKEPHLVPEKIFELGEEGFRRFSRWIAHYFLVVLVVAFVCWLVLLFSENSWHADMPGVPENLHCQVVQSNLTSVLSEIPWCGHALCLWWDKKYN